MRFLKTRSLPRTYAALTGALDVRTGGLFAEADLPDLRAASPRDRSLLSGQDGPLLS